MKQAVCDTEVNQRAVAKACDSLEWASTTASRGVVALDTEFVDVIVDAGDFGWEPTLYVLANNPLELLTLSWPLWHDKRRLFPPQLRC